MPTPRPRTTRLPKEQRRRQLLQVALTVFSERGYHGASMEEIASSSQSLAQLALELRDAVGKFKV